MKLLKAAQLKNKKLETYAHTKQRCNLLRRKTIVSFLWVLFGALLGVFIPALLLKRMPLPSGLSLLAIISVVCFAWATLGRLGWKGQSFGGETIFEELDAVIFWVLYWFGTLLGTAAIVGSVS